MLLCSGVTGTGVDRVADLLCALVTRRRAITTAGSSSAGTRRGMPAPRSASPRTPTARPSSTSSAPSPTRSSARSRCSRCSRGRCARATGCATPRRARRSGFRRSSGCAGAQHLPADALRTGEVGAVAKLTGSPSGSVLWSRPHGTARPAPLPRREPVYAVSLAPATQSDDAKLSTALARLLAEDETLLIDRAGGETILRGLGETHVAVAVERLARVLGVHVTTGPAPVAYRETIAKPAQAEGKLKKQSGGHGQFAVVQLRVSPLPPGGGFEFVDAVVGGAVPRSYIPAVEKGARDALAAGGPQGHPVVDVRVELYDGKSHSVDSSEMAFRTAASLGVKAALADAGHRRARAGVDRDHHRARRPAGPRAHRPLLAPRACHRHREHRRRRHAHRGERARGGARPLRPRAALAHRRPGAADDHPRPLRARARAPRGASSPAARGRAVTWRGRNDAVRKMEHWARHPTAPVTHPGSTPGVRTWR